MGPPPQHFTGINTAGNLVPVAYTAQAPMALLAQTVPPPQQHAPVADHVGSLVAKLAAQGVQIGTIHSVTDSGFGSISTPDGADLFVTASECQAFGGVIPPEGTNVAFQVVTDSTGA